MTKTQEVRERNLRVEPGAYRVGRNKLNASLKQIDAIAMQELDSNGAPVVPDASKSFMGPKLHMQLQASDEIREMCEKYVENFSENALELLRASLKDLPIRKSGSITTAERESLASKNRKGKYGKKPDIIEINDGMFWMHKGCSPTKEEFGIVGIQVAGAWLYLKVLIRDEDEIHCLYELCSTL
ncbi:7972_t:CDS:2 [Gigaspora rosea]|nr:7972_t:CDS:2 [Gigaspora rosea]